MESNAPSTPAHRPAREATTAATAPTADPADASPLVRATGLSVRLGGAEVLSGVDLTIAPGEVVTVIGPNGSGKTTLVKSVLGLIQPAAGRVERRPALNIGYVPQRLAVDHSLPLSLGRLMTVAGPADRAAVAAALDRVGIGALARVPVQDLSGGEFQRALLARAILRRPDLLVLDEPVQGVDFAGQVALYELIGRLRQELACGILMVSHDLHFVMAQTDMVICLNRHICCAGSPKSVAADPEYRRLFGPRAVEALAVYSHRHDHTHGPHGEVLPLNGAGIGASSAHSHGDGAVCHLPHGDETGERSSNG